MSVFSPEQQRELAHRLTTFLSLYKHVSDSYIIEFFTEDLWQSLPRRWQPVLQELTYTQIADLLLDNTQRDRRYPSVWPLSLLAFRATAHSLALPRATGSERGGGAKPREFLGNHSQSSLLAHIFRKHVKPKKQHEIRKLGTLVKQLCDQTDCSRVLDVGSGQGHLTRFLSFGLKLSVTAIEANHSLVATATKFDGELISVIEKERQKKDCSSVASLSQFSPRHVVGWVNPKASWESFFKQLSDNEGPLTPPGPINSPLTPPGPSSKRPRCSEQPGTTHTDSGGLDFDWTSQEKSNNSDFVLTGLHACGDLSATLLRHFVSCPHVRGITSVACCYMKISTREDPSPPGLVPGDCPNPSHPAGQESQSQCGYPMSECVSGLPGHQLSYKAREGACHAIEDYMERLREGSLLLRSHCYRATLEHFIRDARPDLRRAGIQTIKKSHLLTFNEYACLGLPRVGLPPALPLDAGRAAAMLAEQSRVVVYFSISLLLAPAVETLILLDRMIYLQENGVNSQLVPLFDPKMSPRNFVLVAQKPSR